MKSLAVLTVLVLFGAQGSSAADAHAAQPAEQRSGTSARPMWAWQVTPYVWAADLSGKVSPFRRAPTIGIDKSFSDVLEDLDFGGFVNVWGRFDRFVFSGDVLYVSTTEVGTSGPLPPLPVPVPPGTVIQGSVDSEQFVAALQGGYRVFDAPDFWLDALAGLRFWHISNDVTVSALQASRSYGESFEWVDPVIGLRAFYRMTAQLSLQAQTDMIGFGAASEFSWSALATVNYIVTDNLSFSAGYKMLDVDYDHEGHVYDTRLAGPVLGATWRF